MGTLVRIDIVEGAETREDADGIEVIRIALVENLSGNGDAKLLDAINTPGIPKIGDPHPSIPLINVFNRSAVPAKSSSKATVRISYKLLEAFEEEADDTKLPTIDVGSTTQTMRTSRFINDVSNPADPKPPPEPDPANPDQDGRTMIVSYQFPQDPNSTVEVVADPQAVFVDIQVPSTVLRLSRKEFLSPLINSINFVGRVNKNPILGDIVARTWLCIRIDGKSNDGGITYNITYEFQRAISEDFDGVESSGWDATITYIDDSNGKPPPDIRSTKQLGKAVKIFQVYPEKDFAELNLSLDLLII